MRHGGRKKELRSLLQETFPLLNSVVSVTQPGAQISFLLGECTKPQNYSLHGLQNISSIFPVEVEQEELRTSLSST